MNNCAMRSSVAREANTESAQGVSQQKKGGLDFSVETATFDLFKKPLMIKKTQQKSIDLYDFMSLSKFISGLNI